MADTNLKFDSIASQFRDLDGLHPGLWPIIPRLSLAAGVFAVVLVLAYFFYWSGQVEGIERGEAEEARLIEEFKVKTQQSISLEQLKERKELVLQYVSRMEKQLPSKAEIDAVLRDINLAANGRGLSMENFKPTAPIIKDYYAEQPIEIQMVAGYHDLGSFVGDISKLSRIVTLNNLTFVVSKDNKKPGIVLDGLAKTYRYLDPEEIAEMAEQKKKDKKEKGGAAK